MLLNCGVGEASLRVPWTARRSNQSILTEISPKYSLEGLMLKLKRQYSGHLMWRTDSFIGKDPDTGKDWRQQENGTTEDEMVGWHHQLDGHEFEQATGVRTGKPSMLQSMGSQRVGHDWVTELNWLILGKGEILIRVNCEIQDYLPMLFLAIDRCVQCLRSSLKRNAPKLACVCVCVCREGRTTYT